MGEEDHAEKIAIEEAKAAGADLSKSVVYTTLEPCTAGVRRRTLDSCADRLVAAQPRKVVIGIHDPNLDVCGKGFLRLQNAGIATELFPRELAIHITALNAEFIRAQQSLGIKITHPAHGARVDTEVGGILKLRGTWINKPGPNDHVYVLIRSGQTWWPQETQLEPRLGTDEEWIAEIRLGVLGLHEVLVGKVNPLGRTLFDYYKRVRTVHEKWTEKLRVDLGNQAFVLPGTAWIGIEMAGPPKGIDKEDAVQFEVARLL